MHLHEYQAKKLLSPYGIPVGSFEVIADLQDISSALDRLLLKDSAVLKIQVHAGGRKKAGGVRIAKNRQEILSFAKDLLGMKMINLQTGPQGVIAKQILLTAPASIQQEFYVAIILDREQAANVLILSKEGGIDIEETAVKSPEKIYKVFLPLSGKLPHFRLFAAAKFLGFQGTEAEKFIQILEGLIKAFIAFDALIIEINPLVLTMQKEFLALDIKMSVDDNALYRHPELALLYDSSQLSFYEAKAKEHDLAYVSLDGDIGCLVNGAGLAMATVDIIGHYGGKPANFLDVGGSASAEKIAEGFKLLLSDPKVKAILVNIFGGIMNCATLAEGIIFAAKQMAVKIPLIIRLVGTNADKGKKMLQESDLNIIPADQLEEAAKKAVFAAKEEALGGHSSQ